MAQQDHFDFGEPEAIPAAVEMQAEEPASSKPRWNWWNPIPAGLSPREQMIWQIRRDKRALLEEDEEWWADFYADRIVAFQQQIKAMANDKAGGATQ